MLQTPNLIYGSGWRGCCQGGIFHVLRVIRYCSEFASVVLARLYLFGYGVSSLSWENWCCEMRSLFATSLFYQYWAGLIQVPSVPSWLGRGRACPRSSSLPDGRVGFRFVNSIHCQLVFEEQRFCWLALGLHFRKHSEMWGLLYCFTFLLLLNHFGWACCWYLSLWIRHIGEVLHLQVSYLGFWCVDSSS